MEQGYLDDEVPNRIQQATSHCFCFSSVEVQEVSLHAHEKRAIVEIFRKSLALRESKTGSREIDYPSIFLLEHTRSDNLTLSHLVQRDQIPSSTI